MDRLSGLLLRDVAPAHGAQMKHGGKTEQHKASIHRRLDAMRLQFSGRWRGAMYLLGYAVECSLKARLIERHERYGVHTLLGLQDHLAGRLKTRPDVRTHSLIRLMEWTGAEHRMDGRTKRLWGVVCKWTVDWRYNPNQGSKQECEDFFEASEAILRFILNSV